MSRTRAEYRLWDENTGESEPFWKIKDADKYEVLARKMCNFFVLNGKVYQRLSNTTELDKYGDKLDVIYVRESKEEVFDDAKIYDKVGIEFREFIDGKVDSPFLTRWETHDHKTVFLDVLMNDEIDVFDDGNYWRHIDSDFDQDRLTYVVYVKDQSHQE